MKVNHASDSRRARSVGSSAGTGRDKSATFTLNPAVAAGVLAVIVAVIAFGLWHVLAGSPAEGSASALPAHGPIAASAAPAAQAGSPAAAQTAQSPAGTTLQLPRGVAPPMGGPGTD